MCEKSRTFAVGFNRSAVKHEKNCSRKTAPLAVFNRSAVKHEKNGYVDGFVNLANLS